MLGAQHPLQGPVIADCSGNQQDPSYSQIAALRVGGGKCSQGG